MVDWALFTINIDPFFRATFRRISRETSRSKICTYIFESSNFHPRDNFAKFRERSFDGWSPASTASFQVSSLSLSFSFLPSFFLSINFGRVSSQLRRSASNGRAWNFLDRRRLHYDSKSVGDCVVAKIARGKRVIPRGSRHSRVFGYTCSLSPSLFPFRTRFRSVNFFTSPAAMPRDARAKIIADLRQINYKITRISRDSNISTRPNSRRFLEVSQGRRRWKSKRKRFFYWRSVINELFDRV